MKILTRTFGLAVALSFSTAAWSQTATTVNIDASAGQHAINPQIYGVAYASTQQLLDLNTPLNRLGGNNTSRYNWQLNADNRGQDWYFQSIGDASATAGERGDSFIQSAKAAGAQAMITIPTIGWVAKLGANRSKLSSFSIAKYGAQTGSDWQWFPDAGNGILSSTGNPVVGNDANDANVPSDSIFQQGWVNHLITRWGNANSGGLKYYILDNEPSIWHATHRDVHPNGATMEEIRDKIINYATKIKAADAGAQIVGPEEWGWSGYFYSGADQQWGATHGWSNYPDRAAHANQDYLPWLLQQLKANNDATGKRLLDVFTVHYYPQDGSFSDDVSSAAQLKRNRDTRALWDANYVDATWINDKINLIPRLKGWINSYYPNTKIGVTEYNFGAENHINGATTQADVFGIFGREGLDMAARWTTPATTTPTFKAMQMFRNYDGAKNGFGDLSVNCNVPNPDVLSAFAATRSSDGALTIMVINKDANSAALSLNLANFAAGNSAQLWQLTSANVILHLSDVALSNLSTQLATTVPAQSITLFIVPKSVVTPTPTPTPVVTPTPTPSPTPSPTATPVATPTPTPRPTSTPTPTATPVMTPTPTPNPTPTPLPTPRAPSFSSSATARPNPVTFGKSTTVSVNVTNVGGATSNAVVDVEIYSPTQQVVQRFWTGQNFAAGRKRTYSFGWKPTARGTYTVKIGVFGPNWSPMYYWNNSATTIVVK